MEASYHQMQQYEIHLSHLFQFYLNSSAGTVFPSPKNTNFLSMLTNILTFPQCEDTSIEVGQPSASHLQGIGKGREDM